MVRASIVGAPIPPRLISSRTTITIIITIAIITSSAIGDAIWRSGVGATIVIITVDAT